MRVRVKVRVRVRVRVGVRVRVRVGVRVRGRVRVRVRVRVTCEQVERCGREFDIDGRLASHHPYLVGLELGLGLVLGLGLGLGLGSGLGLPLRCSACRKSASPRVCPCGPSLRQRAPWDRCRSQPR